jgi:hypothetical protein
VSEASGLSVTRLSPGLHFTLPLPIPSSVLDTIIPGLQYHHGADPEQGEGQDKQNAGRAELRHGKEDRGQEANRPTMAGYFSMRRMARM